MESVEVLRLRVETGGESCFTTGRAGDVGDRVGRVAEQVLGDVLQQCVEVRHGRITATPIPVSHSGIGE